MLCREKLKNVLSCDYRNGEYIANLKKCVFTKKVIEYLGDIGIESDAIEYQSVNYNINKATNDVTSNTLFTLHTSTAENETSYYDTAYHNTSTPQDCVELVNSSS